MGDSNTTNADLISISDCITRQQTTFQYLSFLTGMMLGVGFVVVLIQIAIYGRKKTFLAQLPMWASIAWFANILVWAPYGLTTGPIQQATGTLACVFDALAKICVIFYVSIRVMLVVTLNDRYKLLLYTLNGLGVFMSCTSDFALGIVFFITVDSGTASFLNAYYYFADVYISFAEIITLIIYLKFKYHLSTVREMWQTIIDCNLTDAWYSMLFFAVISKDFAVIFGISNF